MKNANLFREIGAENFSAWRCETRGIFRGHHALESRIAKRLRCEVNPELGRGFFFYFNTRIF